MCSQGQRDRVLPCERIACLLQLVDNEIAPQSPGLHHRKVLSVLAAMRGFCTLPTLQLSTHLRQDFDGNASLTISGCGMMEHL